ncbi:MAG: malectin domain-containing carbohydrate-binding protein [Terracidiphilus sp.]
MNSQNIFSGSQTLLGLMKPSGAQPESHYLANIYTSDHLRWVCRPWLIVVTILLLISTMNSIRANAQPEPPASDRITINLSQGVPNFVGNTADTDPTAALPQSNWWYENNQDSNPTSTSFAATSYTEVAVPAADAGPSCGSTISTPNWTQVGIPTEANLWRTFINQPSGGGQGSVCGQNNWYRLHFLVSPTYANSKIMVEFEGAHTGAQVYINGTLLPGISTISADAQASHVVGFIPFIVDLTPYLKTDGATENVLAVSVSRDNTWFEDPEFSEVFRFGQAMAGLFRPVKMFITNKVHIPVNVYSNQATWGTYAATVSEVPSSTNTAQAASAVIQVETNVLNETSSSQVVTLTTQIVDENGDVVATGAPITQTVAAMTPGNFPSTATPMFSQQITMTNPTLWYPNNSIYGTPYMYTVNHIVSVGGVVVDVAQTPLGVRTITWNTDYPIFNGYPMNLWGASGRYDYPGLGSSVPEEQQWRDLSLLAAEGGNIYRPGHSTSSEEFVNAADAYGIMIDQPSGDNEEAFAAAGNPSADMITLKEELHRDMIIRDRSHPSILDWESNNGTMEESVGTALLAINSQWDPINTRVAADRTPDNVNGYLLGCTLEGCEVGVKETTDSALGQNLTNNPAWGSEYWGTGTARGLAWNYELEFVAPFLSNWRQGRAADAMGMAQWYLADTPGETGQYIEAGASTTAPGNSNAVRSLGASSMDQNRFPKLLYYVYEAAWTPFAIKPVVRLAGHWNYASGNVQVNAFSNCPSVKLLLNGVQQGSIETPNPWSSNDTANETETDTLIPLQTSWIVPWASGTIEAECLNESGTVVATDSRTTAGAENKIVLTVTPELTKPGADGTTFQVTANGSDAAFVTATVEDANGNWEPLASDTLTFSVSGPATYQGGTQQYVSTNTDTYSNANSTYVNGVPDAFYMAPGDPELAVEGGITKIALRSQFTPGTVTVTATAPGLTSGSASYTIVAVPDPRTAVNNCTAVPSAPTGLGETASTSTVAPYAGIVSLTWTAVTPPANCAIGFYNIYSSTTSGFTPSSSNEIASGITSASYSASGLAASTTYYFIVEAVDQDGTSGASSQIAATTPATPACTAVPSAPTGLTPTLSTSTSISLTWTATTPPAYCSISSYSVYGGTTANPTALIASGLTGTTYTNTGLSAATTYYYVVKAVDADGTSAASAQASDTTQAAGSVSINAGGPAVSNSGGGDYSFVADEDYGTAGTTYSVTTPIVIPASVTDAAPEAVYQDARQGAVTYTIPGLTAGTIYIVRLHFAELYFTAAGSRVFDVSINGAAVLTNFDIVAASGAQYTAMVEQFTTTPNSGGDIVIAFTAITDQPMINGIEVFGASTACTTVPSAPTNLTATATSSSEIGLTWTAVTPPANCSVSSYNVYGGTTQNPSTLIASGVTGASYYNTGLAASTTYYYVVKALDVDGASAASGQASAETSATSTCNAVPPTGPTTLTAAAASSSAITLSWPTGFANPPCTVTGYDVFRGTTNGFTPGSGNLIASGVTGTTYTDTGLAASTTYYYLVETLDSYGASAASPQASTETLPNNGSCTAVPSAPTGLTATASSSTAIGVSWGAVTPPTNCSVSSYSVYGSTTSGFTPGSGNLLSSFVTGTTYTNTGLSASTTYYYKVEATDADGTSAASTQATATTLPISGGVSIDAGGAAVSNSGGGDNSFVADEDYTGGGTYSVTNTITIPSAIAATAAPAAVYQSARQGTTTYTVPGLTAGSTYTVRLHFAELYFSTAGSREFDVAINGTTVLTNFDIYGTANANYTAVVEQFTATANSSGQVVIAFTNGAKDQPMINGVEVLGSSTSCSTVPSAPAGLTATTSSSSSIGLSWGAVTPPADCSISSYTVYGGTTANPTTVIASGVTGMTYSNTGLAASTTYYYLVKAVDADGTSAASNQASAETSAPSCTTVPSAPTGLTATASSSTAIGLSWTPVTPPANCSISSYTVYGGTTANPTTVIASGVTGTTYSNTGLTASTTYYYVVRAVDGDGTSAASAQASAETLTGTQGEIVAIAAGGPAESNSDGGDYSFVADEYFSGGGDNAVVTNTINLTQPGANAAPMAVYQHGRSGIFTYTIPNLTAGTQYTVLLHFAETYFSAKGDRVFNVAINGTTVLSNFDIYGTVGKDAALVEQFTATANSSGQIVIAFTNGTADQPLLMGLEVR